MRPAPHPDLWQRSMRSGPMRAASFSWPSSTSRPMSCQRPRLLLATCVRLVRPVSTDFFQWCCTWLGTPSSWWCFMPCRAPR
eukprot:6018070-Pyramimonas_sp.AAC.1